MQTLTLLLSGFLLDSETGDVIRDHNRQPFVFETINAARCYAEQEHPEKSFELESF